MKVLAFLLSIAFCLLFFPLWSQPPAGYGFGKNLLIQSSQVVGGLDFINFPILVDITDPNLRSTANGGVIENANGFDVLFTLADCSTPFRFSN